MDQYDIGGVVGKGSFGVVVLVTRRCDGAQFVMKRLPIQNASLAEMDAYQNEIRLLSELEHPGIVGYIESFVDRASMDLCIVMAWCSGGDLSSLIKLQSQAKAKRLTEPEIKYLFVQMALALHFMHASNILHRDLKTGNIFLTGGHVVLGDLGISKVLNGAQDLAQTCIGTPYYMSPELFKNKPYNAKSDIWAMGCILYELTSLKHAFDAQNINGLANKVINGIYPPIATSYSKDLRDLIKSMLGVTPSSRPSMKQILLLPGLLKPLKKYIRHVAASSGAATLAADSSSSSSSPASPHGGATEYRPAHVQNLRTQLEKLGAPLSGLFALVEKERAEKRATAAAAAGVASDKDAPVAATPGQRRRRAAAAATSDLYDEDELSPIDRTMVAPGGSGGSHVGPHAADQAAAASHPPTVRRKKGPPGGMQARLAALDAEHAARVEELRLEEEAKAKLEKDFARLQAMQQQRLARLQQRKAQAGRGGGGGDASTASTSKDSSAGSVSGSSLPVISPPMHAQSPISPPLGAPLSLPALPTASPSFGAQPSAPGSTSSRTSPALPPSRLKQPAAGKPPTLSLASHVRTPSPAILPMMPFAPAPAAAVASSAISPASSPRGSGIPRRLHGPSAPVIPNQPQVHPMPPQPPPSSSSLHDAESKDSLSPNPTASPTGPADGLKLLKRKLLNPDLHGAPSSSPIAGTHSLAHPSTVPDASSASSSSSQPIVKRGRPRVGKPPFPPPAAALPPADDIESTLLHEKLELERLRDERLRLERLLTKMDEDSHLFADAALGGIKAPSPRLAAAPAPPPPAHTFSASTVLPSAFDAPLQYRRDRAAAAAGVTVAAPAAAAAAVAVKPSRRHSLHAVDTSHPLPLGALPRGSPTGSPTVSASSLGEGGTRDRILAAKAAKRTEEATIEQARLQQARKDYFADRAQAQQRTRDHIHGSSGPVTSAAAAAGDDPPALKVLLQAQAKYGASSASPGASDDAATLLIYDDAYLADHLNSDLLPARGAGGGVAPPTLLDDDEESVSASSLEVEEFQQHLQQYTRRIENLRSVIEVTSRAGGQRPTVHPQQPHQPHPTHHHHHHQPAAAYEYEDDSESEDDAPTAYDRSPSPESPQQPVHESVDARIKSLTKECVSLVGRETFVKAYDFLVEVQRHPERWDDDDQLLDQLTQMMGDDKVRYWKRLDLLVFLRSDSETTP